MVPEPPKAIAMIEHITGREVGADGRFVVGEAVKLTEAG